MFITKYQCSLFMMISTCSFDAHLIFVTNPLHGLQNVIKHDAIMTNWSAVMIKMTFSLINGIKFQHLQSGTDQLSVNNKTKPQGSSTYNQAEKRATKFKPIKESDQTTRKQLRATLQFDSVGTNQTFPRPPSSPSLCNHA